MLYAYDATLSILQSFHTPQNTYILCALHEQLWVDQWPCEDMDYKQNYLSTREGFSRKFFVIPDSQIHVLVEMMMNKDSLPTFGL